MNKKYLSPEIEAIELALQDFLETSSSGSTDDEDPWDPNDFTWEAKEYDSSVFGG